MKIGRSWLLIISLFLAACKPGIPASPTMSAPASQPPADQFPQSTTTGTPIKPPAEPADLIFHNGVVLTMEPDHWRAQALAIQGEQIVAVGSDEQILALQGPDTLAIDLQGRTIMPGFVDAHSHLLGDAGLAGLDLDQAQQQALAYGITTSAELFVSPEFLREMQDYQQAGKFRMRTSLYLAYSTNCGDVLGDWYQEFPPTRDPGEMMRVGGVKIYADGGTCGRAALSTGYPDGGHGDLWYTRDGLNQAVESIQAAGYQVAIHAQGDLAIEQALNAIEFSLGGSANLLRHRIDHNPFVRPDLLGRYSEIGIIPIAWGEYPTCAEVNDNYYSAYFGQEPMSWLENWRAFLDANPNLPAAWHSDFPYASPDPFVHLFSLVTRQEIDEDGSICQPPEWLASHSITIEEALPMMTINGAYALFRETEVGSLSPGKWADLIILSDDPTTIDPLEIMDLEVWMTMVGGSVEYCRPGQETLCPEPAEETFATGNIAEGTSTNLALGQPVLASRSKLDGPPENAVDGTDAIWSAGADSPQWIEIDLGGPSLVEAIRLTVAQYPEGKTIHRIEAAGPGESLRLLTSLEGFTKENQVLEFRPEAPLTGIARIRITTTVSPSWIAWHEIEIIGVPQE